jgi:hypothetical protein
MSPLLRLVSGNIPDSQPTGFYVHNGQQALKSKKLSDKTKFSRTAFSPPNPRTGGHKKFASCRFNSASTCGKAASNHHMPPTAPNRSQMLLYLSKILDMLFTLG